jgi:ABC-type Fe3+-hydroxamate transport system substrate-binding protein
MGNRIELSVSPVRIVSLVPSQTELLYDLGLDKEVVGITKYCVHPEHWLKEKTIVGGTKKFDLEIIEGLRPDLIIGNKEENYEEGIVALQKKFPVWMSDIYSFEDALQMIEGVGKVVGKHQESCDLVGRVQLHFQTLRVNPKRRTLYLIWRKPWMAAGTNTFINSMLSRTGLQNCLPESSRYPELSENEIKELGPEIILLSSEPYPFKQKHIAEIQNYLPNAKVMLVDGEMFSWYGSRLLKAGEYFNTLEV